jgi:hypothetical protein
MAPPSRFMSGKGAHVAGKWASEGVWAQKRAPIASCLIWTAVNPLVFPPPRTLDHWASRSVMGETLWAKRKSTPLPPRHRTAAIVRSSLSAAGVAFLVWGLVVLDLRITRFGLVDRMALLSDDVSSVAVPARRRTDR